MDALLGRLHVHPRLRPEPKLQPLASLDGVPAECGAQLRQERAERDARRRGAFTRPEHLRERVAFHRPAPVEHQVREEEDALAPGEPPLRPDAVPLHAHGTAGLDARVHR